MADDFCVEHGYAHMVHPKHWGSIPYCAECDRQRNDDLTIPNFLRATGPGTPCEVIKTDNSTGTTRPPGIAPGAWEEMNKPEHRAAREARDAVREYENGKRLAELEQRRLENPELARMERKAKRDAARRVAKLGIKATGKRRRSK